MECSGEEISSLGQFGFGKYGYMVTGEISTDQDIEDVQVGFGEDSFIKIEIGYPVYFIDWQYRNPFRSGDPIGLLGLISAGESKPFKLSFEYFHIIRECEVSVVWTEWRKNRVVYTLESRIEDSCNIEDYFMGIMSDGAGGVGCLSWWGWVC